jgi:hypothetical protein
MPKLPLDPAALRLLPGVAIDAVRHPCRTAGQVVNGSISVIGRLVDRRPAGEPVPGVVAAADDAAPAGTEPPGPVAAEPTAVEDSLEDLAEAPAETAALDEDEAPADVRAEGPVPHMPPRIAGDVERDYAEDIPGIISAGGNG